MIILGTLAAILAAGLFYQRFEGRRCARQYAPVGQLVDVGGHRLHVNCTGEGSPLVLLDAGIAASSLSWARVQPDIARFTRVCAYDRAGLGWSDVSSQPRTFERIVDELASVLARVTRGPSILVGHSFGSFVIRAYAMRFPSLVAGLVLVDPPMDWLTITPQRAYLLRRGRRLARVGAWLAHVGIVRASLSMLMRGATGGPRRLSQMFGPTAARTLARLVGEVRKLPPEIHPVVQSFWSESRCFNAMADYLSVLQRDGDAIARIATPPEIPIVVISSGHHSAELVSSQKALADTSANGRHVVATRSTHWVQFDEPELVVEVVKDLVESSRGRLCEAH